MKTDSALNSTNRPQPGADLWKSVLDSLTAEVAVLDHNGVIIAVNEAWRKFAAENNASPEAVGIGVNYLDVCRSARGEDSQLAEEAFRGIHQVLHGFREVFKLEYPCHAPGKNRWFLLHVSRLDSEQPFVVAAHLSITDRKLTEQRLLEAERLAAIADAMQGLSHEGRNALQRSQAHMELLRLHIEDDPEALDLLDRIESSHKHLLGLYEEVRRYAAPIVLHCEPKRLSDLVVEAWTALPSRPVEASLLHVPCNRDLTCDVDPLAIQQVLRVAFDNAISTGVEKPKIEVGYVEDEVEGLPARTIIVSDNGPGLPPEYMTKAFEPFRTTKLSGTGLGLAIAKRIITAHGGRIRFGTPTGGGAQLYITLPIHGPSGAH